MSKVGLNWVNLKQYHQAMVIMQVCMLDRPFMKLLVYLHPGIYFHSVWCLNSLLIILIGLCRFYMYFWYIVYLLSRDNYRFHGGKIVSVNHNITWIFRRNFYLGLSLSANPVMFFSGDPLLFIGCFHPQSMVFQKLGSFLVG